MVFTDINREDRLVQKTLAGLLNDLNRLRLVAMNVSV